MSIDKIFLESKYRFQLIIKPRIIKCSVDFFYYLSSYTRALASNMIF